MKTACFWSALSVSRAPAVQRGWPFICCTSHPAGGDWSENRAFWARSLKCSFSCSAHCLYKPLSVWASTSFRYRFQCNWQVKKMKEMWWLNMICLSFTHCLGFIFSLLWLQCKYLSIIILKGSVSRWFLLNLELSENERAWEDVCFKKKTIVQNHIKLPSFSFYCFSFLLFYFFHVLPSGPIKMPALLFIVFFQAVMSTPTRLERQDGTIGGENRILWKWTGQSASGSDGWPH